VGPDSGATAAEPPPYTGPPPLVPLGALPLGAPPVGDEQLRQVLDRLDVQSAADGARALQTMAATLASGEQVEHLVVGRVRDMPCVVARTGRRLLVVADRPGRPLVESLHPLRTVVSLDPSTATLAVSDGRRVMHVVGVRDLDEAIGLVGSDRVDPAWF
ncbi:MAG: hypothetical protein JST64_15505, partial [Actinobacteria bacterium]|nr:hypothetical protein [Actinomycetota bacterium]